MSLTLRYKVKYYPDILALFTFDDQVANPLAFESENPSKSIISLNQADGILTTDYAKNWYGGSALATAWNFNVQINRTRFKNVTHEFWVIPVFTQVNNEEAFRIEVGNAAFVIMDNGQGAFYYTRIGETDIRRTDLVDLPLNIAEWNHIAITHSIPENEEEPASYSVYINGKLYTRVTDATPLILADRTIEGIYAVNLDLDTETGESNGNFIIIDDYIITGNIKYDGGINPLDAAFIPAELTEFITARESNKTKDIPYSVIYTKEGDGITTTSRHVNKDFELEAKKIKLSITKSIYAKPKNINIISNLRTDLGIIYDQTGNSDWENNENLTTVALNSGKVNTNAIYFPGDDNQRLMVRRNLLYGLTEFTIAAWVKSLNGGKVTTLMEIVPSFLVDLIENDLKILDGDSLNIINRYKRAINSRPYDVNASIFDGNIQQFGQGMAISDLPEYNVNDWNYVAMTYKKNKFNLFVNGYLIQSTYTNLAPDSFYLLTKNMYTVLGASFLDDISEENNAAEMYIDDFIIYNSAIFPNTPTLSGGDGDGGLPPVEDTGFKLPGTYEGERGDGVITLVGGIDSDPVTLPGNEQSITVYGGHGMPLEAVSLIGGGGTGDSIAVPGNGYGDGVTICAGNDTITLPGDEPISVSGGTPSTDDPPYISVYKGTPKKKKRVFPPPQGPVDINYGNDGIKFHTLYHYDVAGYRRVHPIYRNVVNSHNLYTRTRRLGYSRWKIAIFRFGV